MATVTKERKIKIFTLLRPIDKDKDKCPPQAGVIVAAIASEPNQRVERPRLIQLLKDGRLKTNQTAERIFSFYRRKLMEMGVIREDERTETYEVEVPDPPAKAEEGASAGAGAGAAAEEKPKKEAAPKKGKAQKS